MNCIINPDFSLSQVGHLTQKRLKEGLEYLTGVDVREMCIRDRYKSYRQIWEQYQNLQERWREAQEFSSLISETDSEFSELKKEIKSLTQEAEDLKIRLLFSETEDSHNAIAVSYTHLDVYKRQGQR